MGLRPHSKNAPAETTLNRKVWNREKQFLTDGDIRGIQMFDTVTRLRVSVQVKTAAAKARMRGWLTGGGNEAEVEQQPANYECGDFKI